MGNRDEKGETVSGLVSAVRQADRRTGPINELGRADYLASKALHAIWRVVKYGERSAAEQLEGLVTEGLGLRPKLPPEHDLELILRAYVDGDEEAQDRVARLARRSAQVSMAVGSARRDAKQTKRARPVHPSVRDRREQVRELWLRGHTDFEIAMRLHVSESTVKRDRKELKLIRNRS